MNDVEPLPVGILRVAYARVTYMVLPCQQRRHKTGGKKTNHPSTVPTPTTPRTEKCNTTIETTERKNEEKKNRRGNPVALLQYYE